jgi:hypothetical protein
MKNYVTEQDFMPDLEEQGTIVVTTQYNRPDSWIPFLNTVVIGKLRGRKEIKVEKLKGVYTYQVTKV